MKKPRPRKASHGGAAIAEPCPPAMSEQSHLSLAGSVGQINSFFQKFLELRKSWYTREIVVRAAQAPAEWPAESPARHRASG